jgi:hypothetical protein
LASKEICFVIELETYLGGTQEGMGLKLFPTRLGSRETVLQKNENWILDVSSANRNLALLFRVSSFSDSRSGQQRFLALQKDARKYMDFPTRLKECAENPVVLQR